MVKNWLNKDIKTNLKKILNQLNLFIEESHKDIVQMEEDTAMVEDKIYYAEEFVGVIETALEE